MTRGTSFIKFRVISLVVLSAMVFSGCATAIPITGGNAVYTTSVNIEASDLILGESVNAIGTFSNSQIESGFAIQSLIYKALRGTDYDFIFMPRYERQGSKLTLKGRPAKLKSASSAPNKAPTVKAVPKAKPVTAPVTAPTPVTTP